MKNSIINKFFAVFISINMIFQQVFYAASLEVDTSANKANQPTIEMAPNNKVPVVNIVKPNSNGLSHNKFKNYNVNKEGLILNNSNKSMVKTQLAGYIYGNKNLQNSNTAKTILNEVTSRNKTILRGYTEVAGDSAKVVVANPNGIYIKGAGFINTPKATLTTGSPKFINNRLQGYDINQGIIEIEGESLNFSNIDKAELYSKIVKLNTKINAKNIDIITGENNISIDGKITANDNTSDEKPNFSIDSTALGGIYANKINLIGTQKGVGVNLPVEIVAQDSLKIDSDGKLVLNKIDVQNTLSLASKNSSISLDTISAKDINLNAKSTITNNDTIASKNSIDINTEELINKNSIISGVNQEGKLDDIDNEESYINITTKNLTNNDSEILAKGKISINNEERIDSENSEITSYFNSVIINTNTLNFNNSTLNSNDDFTINSLDKIDLLSSSIASNNINLSSITSGINLSDSNITATNNMLINAKDTLSIDKNSEIKAKETNITTKSIENEGFILGKDLLSLDTSDSIINKGGLSSNENISLTTNNLTNYNTIYSNKDINLYVKNKLLNKTDDSQLDESIDYATIFAKNNINIQGDKQKTQRTKNITNDVAILESNSGNINIFANELLNTNTDLDVEETTNSSYSIHLKTGRSFMGTYYGDDYYHYDGSTSADNSMGHSWNTYFLGAGNEAFRKYAIEHGAYTNLASAYDKNVKLKKEKRYINGKKTYVTILYVNGKAYSDFNVTSVYDDNAKDLDDKHNVYEYHVSTPDKNSVFDYRNEKIDSLIREYYKGFNITKSGTFTFYDDLSYSKGVLRGFILGQPIYKITSNNSSKKNITATRKNLERINKNDTDLSKTSKIVTGGNLNLDISGDLENYVSLISANKNINFQNKNTNLINKSESIGKSSYLLRSDIGRVDFDNTMETYKATIEAGESVSGEIKNLNNSGIKKNVKEYSYKLTSDGNVSADKTNTNIPSNSDIKIEIPTNPYGKFKATKPSEEQEYLIEANELYTNKDNFTGSDYFLEKLNYRADRKVKRLGDAAYETQLVRESIVKQTGKRVITDAFSTDNAQYVKLMDNAINLYKTLDLKVGEEPTQEQLANLTEDIVWMVEKEVNGETVLVPKVYLANNDSQSTASIIAKDTIDLKIKEDTNNSGLIKAENSISIDSNKITNDAGVIISNGEVNLLSKNDFINQDGAKVSGAKVDIKSTNGSIINKTYTNTNTIGDRKNYVTYTVASNQSTIESTNGDLNLEAKKDIINKASKIDSNKSLSLKAEDGDIDLNASEIETASAQKWGSNFDKKRKVRYLQSDIKAGENITLDSGSNINIESGNLNAKENITLNAKDDVTITALNNIDYKDKQRKKKSGFMGSKIKRNMSYKESVVSSNITGKNINIKSDEGKVTLEAAKIKADENIVIDAKKDIEVIAKQYREGELHFTKKSSWGGLKQSASMDRKDALNTKEAKLQTEALNIILKSGNDIKILGSNIEAAADVQLEATNDVLISAVQEMLQEEKWTKKSSFNPLSLITSLGTLGVIDLGPVYEAQLNLKEGANTTAKSSSISAGNNINIDAGSAKVVGSDLTAQNDINATTDVGSIEVLSAQEEENVHTQNKKIEVTMGNIGDYAKSILELTKVLHGLNGNNKDTKLKLTLAKGTYDDVQTSAQNVTNKSSNVTSQDGNIGLDSTENINIQGSNVSAKNGDVTLDAQQNVNIIEAQNTSQSDTKETHAKAEISATVQNEYVEAAKAYEAVAEAAKQLKEAKSNYKKYKNDLKALESDLKTLKEELAQNVPGVDKEDISEFAELISDIKGDEKYYLAGIAAATVNLTSKTTIAIQQTQAAISSSGTYGFSAGLSLDVTGSKTKSNTSSTQAVASNLSGNNITIKTRNDINNQTNISGSNLNAKNDLTIDTNELNVSSSTNTSETTTNTKDISGSVSMTMYGAASGPQVSLGYGQNNSENSSTTNNNSQLNGKNIKTTTKKDTNIKGANVNATELLSMIVGGDLNVESQKDTYNAYQKGFNVSAGFGLGDDSNYSSSNKTQQKTLNNTIGARTGNGEISSVNGGYGASNGRTKVKQTVLTSLTGKDVDIKVDNNTNVKGALIASGEYDENNNFKDNGDLNLETNTLTYQNSTNRVYDSSNSFNVSASVGIGEKQDEKTGEISKTASLTKASLEYANSKTYEKSKTLATIGEGNLNIKDEENSDDTTALNRDTDKVAKDIYSAKTNLDVDMTVDGILIKKIANELKKVIKEFKVEDLPRPTKKQKELAKTFKEKFPDEYKKLLKEIEELTGQELTMEQAVIVAFNGTSPSLGIIIAGKINGKTDEEIENDLDKQLDIQISAAKEIDNNLIGIQESIKNINDILNGDDAEKILAAVELSASIIPIAKAGKYFVKVGDKLVNVSKKGYDKIVDTLKRVEVKVDSNTLGMNGGNIKLGLKNLQKTPSQIKSIKKIDEIEHMLISRDNLSGDILDKGHIEKLLNANKGLTKEVNSLERSLNNPNLSKSVRKEIENKIKRANEIRDRINELTK